MDRLKWPSSFPIFIVHFHSFFRKKWLFDIFAWFNGNEECIGIQLNEKMSEPPCQSQGYLANAPDCIPCLFTIMLKFILMRLRKKCHTYTHLIICNPFSKTLGLRNYVYIDVGDRWLKQNLLVTFLIFWWRFGHFSHQHPLSFPTSLGHHGKTDVTNINKSSPTLSYKHHDVNNITVTF